MNLTVEQRAYIAGILDGEGYLTIHRRKSPKTRTGVWYTSLIVVVNTSQELVDWLKATTNSGSTHLQKRKGNKNHKAAWRWTIQAKQADLLLKEVTPYLIIKKNQAKLLLDFYNLKGKQPGCSGLTDQQWQLRDSFYNKVKLLNKRGKKTDLHITTF